MSKLLPNNYHPAHIDPKVDTIDIKEDELIKRNEKLFQKSSVIDTKQEYDFKENEITEVEKLTNSKILFNIGFGGFSTVKLIYNYQQKAYFAMKVVIY